MVGCLDGIGSAGALPLAGGLAVLGALLVHGAVRRRAEQSSLGAGYTIMCTSENV
eukprot:COSAG02_NODE_155_length_33066_cov_32.167562_31_plen_55_part_00